MEGSMMKERTLFLKTCYVETKLFCILLKNHGIVKTAVQGCSRNGILSSTLPKATLYVFLPIQMVWKFKKLGENQNPIEDFVNKVKNVTNYSKNPVKASRLE